MPFSGAPIAWQAEKTRKIQTGGAEALSAMKTKSASIPKSTIISNVDLIEVGLESKMFLVDKRQSFPPLLESILDGNI